MNNRLLSALGRIARDVVRAGLREATRTNRDNRNTRRKTAPPRQSNGARPTASDYPGDYTGMPTVSYAPVRGDEPDPGEVVWTWVPYEEDHSRGKDRPVVLVGRDGPWLLGLQMTSKDHDFDEQQEARAGRFWVDIGAGAWDNRGRESEVRVNRVIRIDPDAVRRVSVSLPRPLFDEVVAGMRRHL
ncbi:MAG: type II toxin-antitoxin system PemK/MazF family toxin [Propionibacteriaceae bacterium]|nr:type II toxin-antitoxin system PemK/MazF family toxin [Propionibacteriaceae bacterium]